MLYHSTVFLVVLGLSSAIWAPKRAGYDVCYRDRRRCYRGDICIRPDGSSYCKCRSGWAGTFCEKRDYEMPCYSNPCLNGGTCDDTNYPFYTCSCPAGWRGQDCSIMNGCHSSPCKNGGTCTNTENSFTCTCPENWTGQMCSDFGGTFKEEYIILLLWNHFYADDKSSYLYLTTNTPATVQLSTSNDLDPAIKSQIDRNINLDSELKITLPPEMQGIILQKEAKAVRIRSTEPISVVLFDNDYESSDDSSMIISKNKLSTSYIVVSTLPLYPNFPVYSSVFGIAALHEDTRVNVTLKLSDETSSITINGNSYRDLDSFEILLNSLETFQVGHSSDLTGTIVQSSNPVAVFSGNRCNMFSNSMSCSHMMEQLPPTNQWDNKFIVTPDFHSDGSLIRIVSAVDSTLTLSINPNASVAIHAGNFYDLDVASGETISVSADSPLLVAHFFKGTNTNANAGDPYMTLVQGLNQYKDQYKLVVPDGYLTNYVTVTIEKSFVDELRLNGQVVDPQMVRFQSYIGISGQEYTSLTIEVSPGSIEVTTTSSVPFGLSLNGYRSLDSYGFVGSAIFSK